MKIVLNDRRKNRTNISGLGHVMYELCYSTLKDDLLYYSFRQVGVCHIKTSYKIKENWPSVYWGLAKNRTMATIVEKDYEIIEYMEDIFGHSGIKYQFSVLIKTSYYSENLLGFYVHVVR